jgi:hypothetical protein
MKGDILCFPVTTWIPLPNDPYDKSSRTMKGDILCFPVTTWRPSSRTLHMIIADKYRRVFALFWTIVYEQHGFFFFYFFFFLFYLLTARWSWNRIGIVSPYLIRD